jgi:hypothetical protein
MPLCNHAASAQSSQSCEQFGGCVDLCVVLDQDAASATAHPLSMNSRTMNRRCLGAAMLAAGTGFAASPPPLPIGCSDSTRGLGEREFRNYIAAFNRNDFPGFSRYYATNVKFEGRAGTFNSREQVVAFYRDVKSRMRETITIKDVIVGDNEIVANIVTELVALRDWPEFATGPVKKGQTIISENFVWYEIQDAKFVHIRSAGYRRS